jgi:hypothetical protein
MNRIFSILEQRAALLLSIFGFVLILAGNTFECHILKIELGKLLAEVGGLLLIVGILHFLFESSMRRQLIQDIVQTVVGAGRLSASGIRDFMIHSHDVDYGRLIEHSKLLVIGEHYSSGIFERFAPSFDIRRNRELETTVLLLKAGSPAQNYLGYGTIDYTITKIRELIQPLAPNNNRRGPRIKWHKQILRYSFVLTDECIWIKFYRNSRGRSLVPAICIADESELYEFFLKDVFALIEGSEDDD